MKITVTGASGLIGSRLVKALRARGDDVTVLSRSAEKGVRWDPISEPAPVAALSGADAVIHLAGENVAQRWTEKSKRSIRDSREVGTRNLVAGLRTAEPRPRVLLSSSAVGIYGKHGTERLTEDASPGDDFLAEVCIAWEREALAARELGLRVVCMRTGVVLDKDGGALKTMLPPFRMGVGGPVAGGDQYIPWIHADDVVALYLAALDDEAYAGPVNVTAPDPVTNKDFSKRLGKALRRPAVLPVPAFALRLLYGDMAEIVTEGQRAVPDRAQANGFAFAHPDLDEALADALR